MSLFTSRTRIGTHVAAGAALALSGGLLVQACCFIECAYECPGAPPGSGEPCPDEGMTCGPYMVATSCGMERLEASCGVLGWYYESSCQADCTQIDTESACDATFGCLWVVPCLDGPPVPPQCLFVPSGFDDCTAPEGVCPIGTTCSSYHANPCDPKDGSCDGCGAAIAGCVAEDGP